MKDKEPSEEFQVNDPKMAWDRLVGVAKRALTPNNQSREMPPKCASNDRSPRDSNPRA